MFVQVTTNQAQSVTGFHGVYWLTPSGRLESHISGSCASEERGGFVVDEWGCGQADTGGLNMVLLASPVGNRQ